MHLGVHFDWFPWYKTIRSFPLSVLICILLLIVRLMSTTSKQCLLVWVFFQWQKRWLPVGEYKVVCWKGKCQHWGRCARDPHMSVFIERNFAGMEIYLWNPKGIWNITNVHFDHSHLPLKGIKQFFTSHPVRCLQTVNCVFYILSLWFCHQQLFEVPVYVVLNVNERRLYSDHWETQL